MEIEFDLEKWKTQKFDTVTRDGKSCRIICTNAKKNGTSFIVALIRLDNGNECTFEYDIDGRHNSHSSNNDLMLIKKRWKPKDNEKFYFIDKSNDGSFCISSANWNEEKRQFKLYDECNCFKSEYDASNALISIKNMLQDL